MAPYHAPGKTKGWADVKLHIQIIATTGLCGLFRFLSVVSNATLTGTVSAREWVQDLFICLEGSLEQRKDLVFRCSDDLRESFLKPSNCVIRGNPCHQLLIDL